MALDGIFLHKLTEEIKITATNARVDKIYEPTKDEIILSLRSKEFSGKLLLSAKQSTARIGYIDKTPENPLNAPMFCMMLRKYLSGSKIINIEQIGLERVVKITFESRNELGDIINPAIILELISGSTNIIFVNSDGIIADSVRRSNLEKNCRVIQPGAKYVLPAPQEKLNPLQESKEEVIKAILKQKSAPIYEVFLNTVNGVSPLISRELALHCSDNPEAPVKNISEKQIKRSVDLLYYYLENTAPTLITDNLGNVKDFSYMPIRQYSTYNINSADSLLELTNLFYGKKEDDKRMQTASYDTLKLLTNIASRTARKINARKIDLKKAEQKDKYRIFGELIKANIYAIKKGDSSVQVINYYSEMGESITIPLNTALSPSDNASKYFKEYKKLCVASKTLAELITQSEDELKYIESVYDSCVRAQSVKEISEIKDELALSGYIKRPQNYKSKQKKLPPKKYITPDGFTVLSGRNNLQNDELTLKIASKQDLWFHTKDVHGSHIILLLGNKEPTKTAILCAATVAAQNSKGKDSAKVAVDYTYVKYVKKPPRAKYGMVTYKQQKTIYVNPQENICEQVE